jgi:hypothetical protein
LDYFHFGFKVLHREDVGADHLLEDALLERFEVGLTDLEVYHGELELVLLVAESLFLENLCYQVYDLVGRALIIISLLFHIAAKVLPSLHFDTLEV